MCERKPHLFETKPDIQSSTSTASLRVFDRFYTHASTATPQFLCRRLFWLERIESQQRPHILGVDTPDKTETPGTPCTPTYSSVPSTRRCHHVSVRCSRRVQRLQHTAALSHPRMEVVSSSHSLTSLVKITVVHYHHGRHT